MCLFRTYFCDFVQITLYRPLLSMRAFPPKTIITLNEVMKVLD